MFYLRDEKIQQLFMKPGSFFKSYQKCGTLHGSELGPLVFTRHLLPFKTILFKSINFDRMWKKVNKLKPAIGTLTARGRRLEQFIQHKQIKVTGLTQGSRVKSNRWSDREVKRRVQAGWCGWQVKWPELRTSIWESPRPFLLRDGIATHRVNMSPPPSRCFWHRSEGNRYDAALSILIFLECLITSNVFWVC